MIRPGSVALLGLAALACRKPAPPAAFPPAEVGIVTITPRRVDQVFEFVGNVEAFKRVQVRSQVNGVILSRPFTEGQAVRAGQVLYRIDPTAYDADWRAAKARLAEAEARQANMEQNLTRLTALLRDNAISKQEYDNSVSQAKQAQAAVEEARGIVDRARKNLDDTAVRAELSGRVGKALLEVGARVRGSDDVLTTIDVLEPIYVTFRPSGQQLLAWRRDPKSSRLIEPGGPLRVEAILPDGSTLPVQGKLGFIDPVLDPATGTQAFRAQFPNPQRLLLPGQFVRVRLLGMVRDSAIVIPQRAVLQAMGRQTVMVVTPGDTVRPREVAASAWTGDQWVIEHGLAPGDRVVVDGLQKVFPGMKVRPVPVGDGTTRADSAPIPRGPKP
ncbi:MAG TPA: efflux RND transporter periplasmic adaptor subunit [Gemmatimonadales bacterium]|jgi:membrane fusion protein (multidrug efflux system)|nr:efflux RND transporter periplasmic adaptor subunit [Gemmatimonadales bacterium]